MTTPTVPVTDNIIVTLEHQSLKMWDEEQIFARSIEQNKNNTPYIFYDGPPFATGLPHHGHLLASTLKDIIPRYMTMRGYHVRRQFGWDCHGLPIEHEINKSLGLHAHEAVEKLGIAGYNAACRAIVMRYREQWHTVIRRIGRWVDMDNDYKTMDVTFMESVWWVFAQLWQQKLIYKGKKIVPYSCALGTVLSNFEAGSNYQDIQDPSVIIKARLKEKIHGHICDMLLWTTTPWTLPANLALCVHPEAYYVLCQTEDKSSVYIVAEERFSWIQDTMPLHIVEHVKGYDLMGLHYHPLYDLAIEDPMAYSILGDTYVTMDTGTGIVHIAPSYGEDDARVAEKYGITTCLDLLDDTGHFDDTIPTLHTLHFKAAESIILRYFKEHHALYRHSTLVHSYPMCPRSDTPLIYRAIPSWYVDVTTLKERMLAINDTIHWVPEHIQHGRFGQWLASAKDWAISRNRVWGTPLPLWINDVTGAVICMDSREKLAAYTDILVEDLHREHIDHLTFTQASEDGVYRRVPEVLDCWFESGAMPWAQHHYPFKDPEMLISDVFPADFIAEGLDQTRGWFYTLTVISCALKDTAAFKNVIVNGIVTAEDGKKMSKRLNNYTPPMDLMERYGADALRLYMIHSGLVKGEEQRFSDAGVEHMTRSSLLPWLNAVKFFDTYATLENWQMPDAPPVLEHPLDKWIISKSSSLITSIEKAMASYHLYHVIDPLLEFIDALTNTYIRMNRPRFWGTDDNGADNNAFYTLYRVLHEWTLCMAPFAPLIAEAMYQQLKKYTPHNTLTSVHLHDYPHATAAHIDTTLETSIMWMQKIITLTRQARNNARIAVKTPLRNMTIIHREQDVLTLIAHVEHLIRSELNIQTISYTTQEDDYVTVTLKPHSRILGQRLGTSFKAVFEQLKNLTQEDIRLADIHGALSIASHTITRDEWHLERSARSADILTDGSISIQLDTTLDATLLSLGSAREIISAIQKYRKYRNLHVADRIVLRLIASQAILDTLHEHQAMIAKETLSLHFETMLLTDTTTLPETAYLAHDDVYIELIETRSAE